MNSAVAGARCTPHGEKPSVRAAGRRRAPATQGSEAVACARRRSSAGFTLFEMMITLAIFILLVTAVFALLSGVLQSTAALQDSQNRREQMTALHAYLKNKLTSMPARGSITSYVRGSGDGLTQNGVIYGNASMAAAVDAKVQSNGYFTLRITNYTVDTSQSTPQDARQELQQLVTTDDQTVTWTTLLTDVKTLDWKFQDVNATDWVEIWSSGNKPNLIELTLQAAAEIQPMTMDFWLPPITAPSLSAARQTATGQSGTGGQAGTNQDRPGRTSTRSTP